MNLPIPRQVTGLNLSDDAFVAPAGNLMLKFSYKIASADLNGNIAVEDHDGAVPVTELPINKPQLMMAAAEIAAGNL